MVLIVKSIVGYRVTRMWMVRGEKRKLRSVLLEVHKDLVRLG